jgi:hypothetical protein
VLFPAGAKAPKEGVLDRPEAGFAPSSARPLEAG